MPSVRLSLGRYVTVRPRKDGTARVLFEVPPRLRPSGWSPSIPLPLQAPRRGDLADAAEVARIRADADALYLELEAERRGLDEREPGRTVETLIRTWQNSQAWKDNRPRTNQGYEHTLRIVRAWAASLGDPDPAEVGVVEVEALLAVYDDRPTQRLHVRRVGRMVMQQAVRLRWRDDNPFDEVRVAVPKTRVTIWEASDVEQYAWAAVVVGRPDVAAVILTEWEIGQRLTDVVLFQRHRHWKPSQGVFSFDQSKTAEPVSIPVSDRLRAVLAHIARDGSPYLFHDTTGRPFSDVNRLGKAFQEVRAAVVAGGGRKLVLRALRHSCVVQLARAGCTVPEIAAITGHSLASVEEILTAYLPRDSRVAENAQKKRGLIA